MSHNFSAEGAGRKSFCAYKQEETLVLPTLCTPKMLRFLWRIQICIRNMKIFSPPLPTLTWPGFLMYRSSLGGGGWVGLGWAGGLMQEQALGCGLPSLPHHEAELPDCPVPRPSGLSTATRPHRSASGRKIPSSCVALQQPIPTDRHDTTNGWTSEKLPSVRKWRMNTPTRPKWLWRITIGLKTQGDTAVALAKLMT